MSTIAIMKFEPPAVQGAQEPAESDLVIQDL